MIGAKDEYVLEGVEAAYKSLEPIPYWPDTGQAHMTCKGLLVAFAAGVTLFRSTRVFRSEVEESAGGMTSGPSWEKIALEQTRIVKRSGARRQVALLRGNMMERRSSMGIYSSRVRSRGSHRVCFVCRVSGACLYEARPRDPSKPDDAVAVVCK